MRKRDKDKDKHPNRISVKAAKTISFDTAVLKKLEERAYKTHLTVSEIVNNIVKEKVMLDSEWYRQKAKFHYIEFQKWNYLKDEALEMEKAQ